jgi:hypothetical protein
VDLLLPDVSEALDPVNARLLPRLRHLASLGDAEKGIAIGLLDAVLAIDRLRAASRPQPAPEPDPLARRRRP